MKARTATERNLKHDINQKNILRRDLEKRWAAVKRWKAQLETSKKKLHRNKIESSIARYEKEIEILLAELLRRSEDLEKRIKKEMAISEDEIKAFQADREKHAEAVKKAEKALEAKEEKSAKKKTDEDKAAEEGSEAPGTDEKSPEATQTLKKKLAEEKKKVRQDEKELTSEERDKILFIEELKRIAEDKKSYSA